MPRPEETKTTNTATDDYTVWRIARLCLQDLQRCVQSTIYTVKITVFNSAWSYTIHVTIDQKGNSFVFVENLESLEKPFQETSH